MAEQPAPLIPAGRALSTPAQSGEPDVSGLQGVDKLARLMAWHHFGLRWDHMERVSQAEVTAACQAAFDWMNRPLADRQAALSPDTSKAGAVDAVERALRKAHNTFAGLGYPKIGDDICVPGLAAAAALRAYPPPVEAEMVHRYRQALEDVCNPLGYLRRMAEAQGNKLGGMAYAIAGDITTAQRIAQDALSTGPKDMEEGR